MFGISFGIFYLITLVLTGIAIIFVIVLAANFVIKSVSRAALVSSSLLIPLVAAIATLIFYLTGYDPLPAMDHNRNELAVLLGSLIALLLWLSLTKPYERVVTVERANTRVYVELCSRQNQLDAWLRSYKPTYTHEKHIKPECQFALAAYEVAETHSKFIAKELGLTRQHNNSGTNNTDRITSEQGALSDQGRLDSRPALRAWLSAVWKKKPKKTSEGTGDQDGDTLRWVMATGYINLWNRLHRAEEALFYIEPYEIAVGGALYDELRLQGSTMDNRDELLKKLRQAVSVLSPMATRYLIDTVEMQKAQTQAEIDKYKTQLDSIEANSAKSTVGAKHVSPLQLVRQLFSLTIVGRRFIFAQDMGKIPEDQEQELLQQKQKQEQEQKEQEYRQARAVLREVRLTINKYRDDRREGLMRERNNLFETVTFTGLIMYVLLAMIILIGVKKEAIIAAIVYFFVGAAIGLFKRLTDEAGTDTASEEDYGLSRTRMMQAPIFCGIGAIAGVILVALLPLLVNTDLLVPRAPSLPSTVSTTSTTASTEPITSTEPIASTGIVTFTVPITSAITSTAPFTPKAPITSTAIITSTIITSTTVVTSTAPVTLSQATRSTPSSPEAPIITTLSRAFPRLEDVFNLDRNPLSLLVAAIFGLAPSLVIKALQKQADRYKAELKSTGAPDA